MCVPEAASGCLSLSTVEYVGTFLTSEHTTDRTVLPIVPPPPPYSASLELSTAPKAILMDLVGKWAGQAEKRPQGYHQIYNDLILLWANYQSM